jgi:phosphoribosylaminoimidazole (AIR) synthetase
MLRTFNCGYGMIVIIDKKSHTKLKQTLKKYKLSFDILGTLKNKGVSENILFNNAWN